MGVDLNTGGTPPDLKDKRNLTANNAGDIVGTTDGPEQANAIPPPVSSETKADISKDGAVGAPKVKSEKECMLPREGVVLQPTEHN